MLPKVEQGLKSNENSSLKSCDINDTAWGSHLPD